MTLKERAADFMRWRVRQSRIAAMDDLARALLSDKARSGRGKASSGSDFITPAVDRVLNNWRWRNAALRDFAGGDE